MSDGFHTQYSNISIGSMEKEEVGQKQCSGVDTLKEELHVKLLSHLDLCVIFVLLLRDELRVYNHHSVDILRSLLKKQYIPPVLNSDLEDSACYSEQYDTVKTDARNMRWNVVIKEILHSLRTSFGYLEGKDTVEERKQWQLTEEDYDYCSACLKRKAIGLQCLLRRCVCNIKITRQKRARDDCGPSGIIREGAEHLSVDGEELASKKVGDPSLLTTDIKSVSGSSDFVTDTLQLSEVNEDQRYVPAAANVESRHLTSECERCNADPDSSRTVALISPFIYKGNFSLSGGDDGTIKQPVSVEENNSRQLDWVKNNELYTSGVFPLDTVLGRFKNGDGSNYLDDEAGISKNMASQIVGLVKKILEKKDDVPQQKETCDPLVVSIFRHLDALDGSSRLQRVEGVQDNMAPNEDMSTGVAWSEDGSKDGVSIKPLDSKFSAEDPYSESFYKRIEELLIEENSALIKEVNQLMPFPTMYWLTDPVLVSKTSALESCGEIARMQEIIDSHVDRFQSHGSQSSRNFLETLFMDNLAYICRRFELVHPSIIVLLYTILVNTSFFVRFYRSQRSRHRESYIKMSEESSDDNTASRRKISPQLAKAMAIMNTIRCYGIGGNKSFVHIKCLHTNLAFALAEGSTLGNMVFNSLCHNSA